MKGLRLLAGLVPLLAYTDILAADCTTDGDTDARRKAEQMIVLLRRMANDSEPARRVMKSGSEEPNSMLEQARKSAEQAMTAYESECFTRAAQFAGNGLSAASAAFRMSAGNRGESRNRYDVLHERTVGFLQAIESQPRETTGLGEADIVGMHRQLARAEKLALNGDFSAANELLEPVADRLQRRLIDLFDRKTLVYARQFAGPSDEFDYLSEQYRGYRLLLESTESGNGLQGNAPEDIRNLVEQAGRLRAEAVVDAAAGNWEQAIKSMQSAVAGCEQAVRTAGIY